MTTQEAKEIFQKIRSEYAALPYPKYLNANLEELEKKYELLMGLKEYLAGDQTFVQLKNSVSQTIARLSNKGNWSNVSERGVNKSFPYVVKKGSNEMEFPFEWIAGKPPQTCSVNGYWDARNHMVMDVLAYMFLLREGGDRLPKEKSLIFENIESIRTRETELIEQPDDQGGKILSLDEQTLTVLKNQKYWVTFDDQLFRKFTGKMTMHSKEILDLLLETSRVEFKIAFPVRLKENLHTSPLTKTDPFVLIRNDPQNAHDKLTFLIQRNLGGELLGGV